MTEDEIAALPSVVRNDIAMRDRRATLAMTLRHARDDTDVGHGDPTLRN